MKSWSTEFSPEEQQFSYWREIICEAFVMLDPVLKANSTNFIGQVNSHYLYQTRKTNIFSRAQLINRRWEEIRRNPVDYYFANFQLEGSCVVRQDGEETLVNAGDFVIVDTTHPYFLDFREDWRVLSFQIPRHQLASRLRAPRHATARTISGQTGLGLVATSYAKSLEQITLNSSMDVQESLSTSLNSVIALALGATLEIQENDRLSIRDAFRRAIEIYINDNLYDTSLSPDSIARRFGVSRRTLYNIFETSPFSISAMIREQRLLRIAKELQCPNHANILAVALRWGFNDASHFSRLFKSRFGQSPRDFAANKS